MTPNLKVRNCLGIVGRENDLKQPRQLSFILFSGRSNYWKKGWPEGVEVLTV